MSKYITHFQTEAEYQTALPSLDLPNVSLVDELGEVHYHRALYGAHAGDICLYDVAEGQKFFVTAENWNLTTYPTASYPIVGIAIADETTNGVTLCSTYFSDSVGNKLTDDNTKLRFTNSGDPDLNNVPKYANVNLAKSDFNGKTNTTTIISDIIAYDIGHSTDNITGTIFGGIQEFYVTGTNKGDWYVASVGEFNTALANKDIIKTTNDKIYNADHSLAQNNYFGNFQCWSSTLQNTSYVYYLGYVNFNSFSKTGNYSLLPFLKLT